MTVFLFWFCVNLQCFSYAVLILEYFKKRTLTSTSNNCRIFDICSSQTEEICMNNHCIQKIVLLLIRHFLYRSFPVWGLFSSLQILYLASIRGVVVHFSLGILFTCSYHLSCLFSIFLLMEEIIFISRHTLSVLQLSSLIICKHLLRTSISTDLFVSYIFL